MPAIGPTGTRTSTAQGIKLDGLRQTVEGVETRDTSTAPITPGAASDGAQPLGRSANPATEEMRAYHEQRRGERLTHVGDAWMLGSGN